MTRVVLLHGLGRGPSSMRRLASALEEAGFDTLIVGYKSTSGPLSDLADRIAPQLPPRGTLHFVGHSLGGILAKPLMRGLPDTRQGRIVQIGAPNAGSALATRVEFLEPVLGPVLEQLEPGDMPDDSDLDIGAIAGNAALNAYGYITGLDGENDGKVTVKSAWGTAPPDKRIKLPVAHSTMMFDARVIAQTVAFLETGKFLPVTQE